MISPWFRSTAEDLKWPLKWRASLQDGALDPCPLPAHCGSCPGGAALRVARLVTKKPMVRESHSLATALTAVSVP